jgi:hypothetical protein
MDKPANGRNPRIMRWAALGIVSCLVVCVIIVISGRENTTPESATDGRQAQGNETSPGESRVSSKYGKTPTEEVDEPPVRDPSLDIDDETVAAMFRVPVSKFHTQRVGNIRRESILQLVENLANFDDMHLATTSTGSRVYSGTYDAAILCLGHLFRVRRLLAIQRESPKIVTPIMIDCYEKTLEAWPAAYRDWTKRFYGPAERIYEPLAIDKVETGAIVATYMLGESGDVAALGVLVKGYERHEKWLDQYKRGGRTQCPVPPTLTLYAMHRLVTTASDDALTAEAQVACKTYLSWAEDHIPPATGKTVSVWNAKYDEGEPFRKIADPQNALLRKQPKIVIVVYPSRFKDETAFEPGYMPDLSQQGQEWRKRLFAAARAILK